MPRRVVKFTPLNTKQIALTIWGGWLTEDWHSAGHSVHAQGHHLLKMAPFQVTVSFRGDCLQPSYMMSVSISFGQQWWSHSPCQDIALGVEMVTQLSDL